jgi:hypothetical protein
VVPYELERDEMTGQDAMFALIGIRMMKLSQKYNKKLDEMHHLFYSVSCDWDSLEALLQEQQTESMEFESPSTTIQWTVLEDLAVRDTEESEAYQHIVELKSMQEVKKRRRFLEVE